MGRLPLAISCLLAIASFSACGEPAPRPNLLLITLDTTRADRLGCYGYERDTSPALDRLARDAVVHTRARSTSSWTLPAHASLFTGRFPTSHGARYDAQGPLRLASAVRSPGDLTAFRARGLSAEARTLAEMLAEAGYTTGGVVAGPWLKRDFGLQRGFASWDDAGIEALAGRRAEQVTDAALAWLDRHASERFFLFLNYFDPHGPYGDPEGFGEAFLPPGDPDERERRNADYDGEIRYMDRHLGRLLDGLRERGLYDDAWIAVTADHGELLGEHERWGHGYDLSEPELHVPLLVKHPAGGVPPGRSADPVQLVDIVPMLLAELGIEPPAGVQGGLPAAPDHPLFAEVYPLRTKGYRGAWRALFAGDLKLLWNDLGLHRLHDLAADPGERRDLAELQPERVRELTAEVEAFVAGLPRPEGTAAEASEIDAETRRALEGLGYVR